MNTPDEHRQHVQSSRSGEGEVSRNAPRDEGYVSSPIRHPSQSALPPTERRLVELLATIGHEFRTPLTVIEGYTSTLLRRARELPQEEHDEFLHIIQQASRHLEFLLSRLLEIAELEAGNLQIEVSPVDIPALVREAIARAQRHIPALLRDRFTFQLQCRDAGGKPTEEVPLVNGDGRCLHKVLEHLLENAIRYSPEGGSIDVIARPAPQGRMASAHDQAGDTPAFLEICVCDMGLGIPEEHLARIFEHFYRVDTRLTREVYGLGLGLTICHHLVALHHGHLWAESCPDGGSAFHLWLPCEGVPAAP